MPDVTVTVTDGSNQSASVTVPYTVNTASGSWEDSVAQAKLLQSFSPIDSWYLSNVGLAALGLTDDDLEDGSLVATHDGQVFEGIRGPVLRTGYSGVRYRGCKILNGAQYGAYADPTFGASIEDVVIEYCDYEYAQPLTEHHRANLWYPAPIGRQGTVTISHCNMWGWSSGGQYGAGVRIEYCWLHDWQIFSGIHSSSISHNAEDMTSYRNYCTDGTSGCCTLYFDRSAPVHRLTMQENILNGSSPQASPSYLINIKNGEHAATATDVKILGNMFGPERQYGAMAGGDEVPWGTAGNEISGNHEIFTGEIVGG